ncbi:MAG: hypothetical protein IKN32_01110 [Bacteroidales bacterium]|nr:hypothetical protein [Bacteroidales bacterium]
MTVKRKKETAVAKVIMHRVADIRGGVSVVTSELTQDFLPEGAPLSAPDNNGKTHVVKYALVKTNAGDTATQISVYKGHNFKAGDIVFAAENGKAYAISSIDSSNSGYDVITVGTTLGVALTADVSYLLQAKTSGASGAAFKYEPAAINGTGQVIEANSNLITDAWLIAVTKGNKLPSIVAGKLKGIINY